MNVPSLNVLLLPGWDVTKVEEEADKRIVSASYQPQPKACPKCGVGLGDNEAWPKMGSFHQTINDLPTLCLPTVIATQRRRYKCRHCNVTFSQPLPDLHTTGTMTTRLAKHIQKKSIPHSFADVASETGVTEGTVRNLFNQYAKELDRTTVFITPTVLGIDEIHLGHVARLVLTNVSERTLYDMKPDQLKDTLVKRLRQMPNPENVRTVTIDMTERYKDAVQEVFPDAVIVVDKFHVLQCLSKAFALYRTAYQKKLPENERLNFYRNRFLILKRPHDLNYKGKIGLEIFLTEHPLIRQAYDLKESFFGIYDIWDKVAAMRALEKWYTNDSETFKTCFADFVNTLKKWRPEIMAYSENRQTNAYTESHNSLTRSVYRNGRGYSFDVIRAKMVYSEGTYKYRPKKQDQKISMSVTTGEDWSRHPKVEDDPAIGMDGCYGASIPRMEMYFEDEAEEEWFYDSEYG